MPFWRRSGYGARLGGKAALAGLFRPVSTDEQVAAEFRHEHEQGMRAEVLRSVQHALLVWDNATGSGHSQEDFDAVFVALAQLARFRQAHDPDPVIQRVLAECLTAQDDMASAWLQRLPTVAE